MSNTEIRVKMSSMEEEFGKENSQKLLALAGKFAVLSEDELQEKYEQIVEEFNRDTQL